jgi:hypothetical protein
MGNKPTPSQSDTSPPVVLDSLAGRIDLKGYPTPYSDIGALMVFEHQAHMTNLLTYLTWQSRVAELEHAPVSTLNDIVKDVVDYMLFVDETTITGKIEGSSGFTELFSSFGSARRAGPLAPAARSREPPDAISVQLHDLLAGVRGASGGGEGRGVPAHVGDSFPGATKSTGISGSRLPIAARSWKSSATQKRTFPVTSRLHQFEVRSWVTFSRCLFTSTNAGCAVSSSRLWCAARHAVMSVLQGAGSRTIAVGSRRHHES